MAPLRRSSYPNPTENFYSEGFEPVSAPAPNDGDPPPSLVSQLQQVHGLTKKKVYGAKPARQPFFREERVRDKYRAAPASLTMPLPPVDQAPSPTAGGGQSRSPGPSVWRVSGRAVLQSSTRVGSSMANGRGAARACRLPSLIIYLGQHPPHLPTTTPRREAHTSRPCPRTSRRR